MKVLVTDQLFFKAGDECIFIVNQPYNDEYFMTPGKEYPGIIEEVRIGQSTEVSMKNDKGEAVAHSQWFDCFSSGSVTVKAMVEGQEYIDRVYLYRSQKIKEIVESIKEEIDSLDHYIDSKLKIVD